MPEERTTPDLAVISRENIEALNRGDLDVGLSAFRPDAVCDERTAEEQA
jgi:hypothetical protein